MGPQSNDWFLFRERSGKFGHRDTDDTFNDEDCVMIKGQTEGTATYQGKPAIARSPQKLRGKEWFLPQSLQKEPTEPIP